MSWNFSEHFCFSGSSSISSEEEISAKLETGTSHKRTLAAKPKPPGWFWIRMKWQNCNSTETCIFWLVRDNCISSITETAHQYKFSEFVLLMQFSKSFWIKPTCTQCNGQTRRAMRILWKEVYICSGKPVTLQDLKMLCAVAIHMPVVSVVSAWLLEQKTNDASQLYSISWYVSQDFIIWLRCTLNNNDTQIPRG